jgi:WD40 repeat protein
MVRGRRSWICEECDHRAPLEPPAVSATAREDHLPSLLAIPLAEYRSEEQPVLKLHRLCDFVEILTRFCTALALGEIRAAVGEVPLPEALLRELRPRIALPTLGKWRAMLVAAADHLPKAALILPELPDLVAILAGLMPGGKEQAPERCLLTLRNLLAHGGAVTRARADGFLHGESQGVENRFSGWAGPLDALVERLQFLGDCRMCLYDPSETRLLHGMTAAGSLLHLPLESRQELESHALAGHVLLQRGGRWLDLWPFCDHGRPSIPGPHGRLQSREVGPMVYIRAEPTRLLYAALGVDLSFGEREDGVEAFRDLFRIDTGPADHRVEDQDFEAEIQRDADRLVGRQTDLRRAKEQIKAAEQGILWIAGAAGIGKSFLMARLAEDLRGDPRKTCRIAWRFKAGDGMRCSRFAFFRHAITRLAAWERLELPPAEDEADRQMQLTRLLEAVSQRKAENPRDRPPRVLIFLDGLDEIERVDSDFPRLLLSLQRPNVVWVCSGRPEGKLPEILAPDRCKHVFGEGGMGPMSPQDVRAMLLDGAGRFKYDLLRLDEEQGPEVLNEAVAAVVERAGGLPLYVRFVVKDIEAGHFRFSDLRHRLPPGLSAYYEDLLQRLAIGDLHALLTPLMVSIAWGREALGTEILLLLMQRRKALVGGEQAIETLREGLQRLGAMVRAVTSAGGLGYEPYHPTFRDFVKRNDSGRLTQQNALTEAEFCDLARDWQRIPPGHSARLYALRHGPATLRQAGRPQEAADLLLDLRVLEARVEAGLVFELPGDFMETVRALPEEDDRRRLLALLEEALRRDVHFIHRHREDYPQALLECLWISCWWYDCAEAAAHHDLSRCSPDEPLPWQNRGPRLSALLERWRQDRKGLEPGFVWLRSLRPPPQALGTTEKLRLGGHQGGVTSVGYSPDGGRIVSGSWDKTVRIWDSARGDELLVLRGHEAVVTGVGFSPLGNRIGSASRDRTVRVWEASTGALVHCLRMEDEVLAVGWSPDGRRIVAGLADLTARVWDVDRGELLGEALEHDAEVVSVCYSPDGRRILTGSGDGLVRVWNAESGAELLCLPAHGGTVTGLCWSADGNRLISGSQDRTIAVHDADSGVQILRVRVDDLVNGIACSPDGLSLVAGLFDRTVRALDANSGKELLRIRGHDDSVTSVSYSPDGTRILSGSRDKTVRVQEAGRSVQPLSLQGHEGVINTLCFSPDGRYVASGSFDRTVRVWMTASGVMVRVLRGHESSVTCVSYSPDGRRIVSGSRDLTVRIWDAEDGTQLRCLLGHRAVIDSVSVDGGRIISRSCDGEARVWDAESGALLETRQENGPSLVAALSGHDESQAASRLETALPSTVTGQPFVWFPVRLHRLAWHHPTRCAAGAAGSGNNLWLFRIEEG